MVKSAISIITGLLVATIVVSLVGMLGYAVYPPPLGIEVHDMQTLKILIGLVKPLGVFVFILSSWMLGSFTGGYCSAAFAEKSKLNHALVVGAFLMVLGVIAMIQFQPPFWFWVLGLLSFLPFAYAGARASSMNRKPQ